jgi:type III secretion protein C
MMRWLFLLVLTSAARAQTTPPVEVGAPVSANAPGIAISTPEGAPIVLGGPATLVDTPVENAATPDANSTVAPAATWLLRAKDQPIGVFLRNLAQAQGLSIVVDPAVTGNISGDFSNVPLEKMLTDLAGTYDFVWYNDGRAVWIFPESGVEMQVFTSDRYEISRLYDVLKRMDVLNPTIQVKVEAANNVMVLSAPPRVLELATALSKSLEHSAPSTLAERPAVKVYPLTYAWAYDLKFGYGDNSITVPGVATLLSQVMNGATAGSSDDDTMKTAEGQPLSLKPISAETITPSNSGGPGSPAASLAMAKGKGDEAGAPGQITEASSSITSDVRLNAVIVKDRQDRLPMYESLIKAFDKPVRMISITAVIVDLSSSASLNLGMNQLSVSNGSGSLGVFKPAGAAATPIGQSTAATTIVLGSYQIMASIQAQQALGNARIVSQPAVLTFDNMGAIISQDSSFYVQVPGTYNSSLYEVTTGLSLRVTPQILQENGTEKIKLLVTVRDGSVQSQTSAVQGIPQTTENFINTQAVIHEGQSLLIGGIYRSTQQSTITGVPILMKIPILGYFFKNETTENSQVERAYLITPRIITLDAATTSAAEVQQLLPPMSPVTALNSKTIVGLPVYPPGPSVTGGAGSSSTAAPPPPPHSPKS